LPEVERRLDPQALGELFTYWAPLETHSAYARVQALAPGHVLVARGAERRLRRYWDWSFDRVDSAAVRPLADCIEEARALLIDAVRLQLRADVPVGAYLSGGLDSSAITSLIRHYTDTPLRTFSLTFEDAEFDESAHQRSLVRFLGTDHTALRCRKRDIARLLPRSVVSYAVAERRYTKYDRESKVRTLRHQQEENFGQACRFLDLEKRRCTIYEVRPGVCRAYPDSPRCGYYDFLRFEREHQGDDDYIALT